MLVTVAVTAVALLRPSAFEGGTVKRPTSGVLTVGEEIELQKALADERKSARDTGLKVAAGFGALAAALLAWGRIELSRDERRLDKAGHLTERYSKAVEQLGHPTADVQLGGIYALERLALDSISHRRTVIEVLCAYVREHAGPKRTPVETAADEQAKEEATGSDAAGAVTSRQPVTVRAALQVLVRNRTDWTYVYDLTEANLVGVRLRGADLVGADLSRADLVGADLSRAYLSGADLSRAHLSGADLDGAKLGGANLLGANLVAAKLVAANLVEANLVGATLGRADLRGADLRGADLRGVISAGRTSTGRTSRGRTSTGRTSLPRTSTGQPKATGIAIL
jgi:hypothetical protein